MEKTVITISGLPGSGTTTVAKSVSQKIGLNYVDTGVMFRSLAHQYNMSLNVFERFAEDNMEIDIELDKKQERLLRKGSIVMEGRLSGWIAYKNNIASFKIWLDCEKNEAIRRIIEREGGTIHEKKNETVKRISSEKKRYEQIYGINIEDMSIYDLIIDTTTMPADRVVEKIMQKLKP
jgi:predicted cytidylate kinase